MSNRIRQAFDTVSATPQLKADTMQYLEKNVFHKQKRKVHFVRYAVSFACLMLVAFGVTTTVLYYTPVAAVSIDVNPSVEMQINCFDRVISVKGYGDEAEKLTNEVAVKNMKYSQAVEAMLSCKQMSEYINDDSYLNITVYSENESESEEMQKSLFECVNHNNYKAHCEVSALDNEQAQAAKESSMSMGKYRAFLTLKSLNPEISEDEVKDLTMKEIRELIAEYSDEDESAMSTDNEEQENTSPTGENCLQTVCSQGKQHNHGNHSNGKHNNR